MAILLVSLAAGGAPAGIEAADKVAATTPVFLWVLQDGPLRLALESLSVSRASEAVLEVVWTFRPVGEPDRLAFSRGEPLAVTLVAAAERNPNWKTFEIRDTGALVNHLIRPEADFVKTGGSLRYVDAARQLVEGYLPGRSENLYFITFAYPADLGVVREPVDLVVRSNLAPARRSAVEDGFVCGWTRPYGAEISVDMHTGAGVLGSREVLPLLPGGVASGTDEAFRFTARPMRLMLGLAGTTVAGALAIFYVVKSRKRRRGEEGV